MYLTYLNNLTDYTVDGFEIAQITGLESVLVYLTLAT